MNKSFINTKIDASGTATVTMSRPELHNAFDEVLIAELTAELDRLAGQEEVGIVVLAGDGKNFSAGADLNWMRRMADYSEQENVADARALGRMLKLLRDLPKPTIARVHGAAFGGAVGLVAACDIAIAADDAIFAVSEVKLGLIPAVISPYVVAAMGERQARRYALTAERFGADEALRIGLVHQVVGLDDLDAAVGQIIQSLTANSPMAMAEVKELITAVAGRQLDDGLIDDTAGRIARVRASGQGREGVAAFLEKRSPNWRAK